MALEIIVGCVNSLLPPALAGNEVLSGEVQQDDDRSKARAGGASASLTRASTFTSRFIAETEAPDSLSKGGSSNSQSRDSTTSTYSGISDDLQGLLIPGRNVVLRFESISAAELKVILTVLYSFLGMAIGSIIAIGFLRAHEPDRAWLHERAYSKVSLALAANCLLSLLLALGWGGRRIIQSSQKIWLEHRDGCRGRRRRYLVTVTYGLLALQILNVTFWIVPHAVILTVGCSWFDVVVNVSGVIRWTIWNTIFLAFTVSAHNSVPWLEGGRPRPGRPDALILDAPLWHHWPQLLIWLPFQASIIYLLFAWGDMKEGWPKDHCGQDILATCTPPWKVKIVTIIWGGLCGCYQLAYILYNSAAKCRLDNLPYGRYRTGHALLAWQRQAGRWVMLFLGVTFIGMWFSAMDTCPAYFTEWLGLIPLQVATCAAVVANAIFMMPRDVHDSNPVVQAMLQGLSWCEKHRSADLASRNAYLSSHGKVQPLPQAIAQPIFCFETAFKLLTLSRASYAEDARPAGWERECTLPDTLESAPDQLAMSGSCVKDDRHKCYCGFSACEEDQMETGCVHVDNHKEHDEEPSTSELAGAVAMLGLEHAHIIHEADRDTKVIIAWTAGMIVICFRGTASMKNVMHDLQTWRADHPPKRGLKCMGTRPMVHKGFWRSWSSHGVRSRVLDTIARVMAAQGRLAQRMEVRLTGHSLGGALALLAAYDIKETFKFQRLSVHTFGAPRVGNHAFARDYNSVCPNTWQVVNSTDIVPRIGKFGRLYKHPGQRVIIDRKGSILVRPSPLELHLRQGKHSVKEHYLVSYRKAMAAVVRAQFSASKASAGGRAGALALAENEHIMRSLCCEGVDLQAFGKSSPSDRDSGVAVSDSPSEQSSEPGWMPDWTRSALDEVFGPLAETAIMLYMSRGQSDEAEANIGSK